jgi:hypothetical protein
VAVLSIMRFGQADFKAKKYASQKMTTFQG